MGDIIWNVPWSFLFYLLTLRKSKIIKYGNLKSYRSTGKFRKGMGGRSTTGRRTSFQDRKKYSFRIYQGTERYGKGRQNGQLSGKRKNYLRGSLTWPIFHRKRHYRRFFH